MEIKAKTSKIKDTRALVYIDGFNLYFGLRSMRHKKFYWLDLWKMSNHISVGRKLVGAKYFTSDIKGSGSRVSRQQNFLAALEAVSPRLEIVKGKFQDKPLICGKCSYSNGGFEEKMTDVNIATHLVNDAWKDKFDVAIVVSGDSDLVPPIATVKSEFPNKNVLVAFPPNRFSNQLKETTKHFRINQDTLKKCQLPDLIERPGRKDIRRPDRWK